MAGGFQFDLKPEDAAWHPDESKNFFELWDCYCLFEDGGSCFIDFFYRPWYPIIDYHAEEAGKPLCMINVVTPEGERHASRKAYAESEFKASKETLDVTIGENRLIGKFDSNGEYKELYVKSSGENVAAELTYKVKIGAMKMTDRDDNLTYFNPANKKYFGWFIIGSRSEVEGTVTINGKTREVKGVGFNNYNRGNIKFDLQSRWFFSHIHAGDYTLTYNDSTASKRHNYAHFTPLVLWKGNEVIMQTHNCVANGEKYVIDPEAGGPYPIKETFSATEGDMEIMGYMGPGVLADSMKILDIPGLPFDKENPCFHSFQISDVDLIIRKGKDIEKVKGRALREFLWADQWFPFKG